MRLDEPELFTYPIAYLSEPGGWTMSDAELRGLRRYIARGGFIIFDDIEGDPNPDYRNLLAQWHAGFPGLEARPTRQRPPDLQLLLQHRSVEDPEQDAARPGGIPGRSSRTTIRRKRLVAIIDNYADIGEFIEFSDEGFNVVPANEAYKLWVNYFVYALTH